MFAEGKSRLEGETSTKSSQANSSSVAETSPTSNKSLTQRKWVVVKTAKTSKTSQKAPKTPQFSKELCPDGYLDFAAKHDNWTLALKEELHSDDISKAIADAAHYVAARDKKPVFDVFAELERNRLKNGVHRDKNALKAALNRRATSQLRACGIAKPGPAAKSVACKIPAARGVTRCKKHEYCRLMHLEEAAKATREAEAEASEAPDLAS